MAHRDERLPKTVEARAVSHDPLIEDDTPEDKAMFTASEVLAEDEDAQDEAEENAGEDRGRDVEANAENSLEEDESALVADANVNPQPDGDQTNAELAGKDAEDTLDEVDRAAMVGSADEPPAGDRVTKAADVAPNSARARKAIAKDAKAKADES